MSEQISKQARDQREILIYLLVHLGTYDAAAMRCAVMFNHDVVRMMLAWSYGGDSGVNGARIFPSLHVRVLAKYLSGL